MCDCSCIVADEAVNGIGIACMRRVTDWFNEFGLYLDKNKIIMIKQKGKDKD